MPVQTSSPGRCAIGGRFQSSWLYLEISCEAERGNQASREILRPIAEGTLHTSGQLIPMAGSQGMSL